MKSKIGSAGGKVTAIRQRQDALQKYYAHPNLCKFCHSIISVPDKIKVSTIREKQFCNHSCHAKFWNGKRKTKNPPKHRFCEDCNFDFGLASPTQRTQCQKCKMIQI